MPFRGVFIRREWRHGEQFNWPTPSFLTSFHHIRSLSFPYRPPSAKPSIDTPCRFYLPCLEWDDARLCVLLTLLVAVLARRNDPETQLSPAASLSEGKGHVTVPLSLLGDTAHFLLDYSMEINWNARSRSSAAS